MNDRHTFRAYDPILNRYLFDGKAFHPIGEITVFGEVGRYCNFHKGDHNTSLERITTIELEQCTGLSKNNKPVFEGDIFRVEEETDDLYRVYYLVVTWIKEWAMFAMLRPDEYEEYNTRGVKALDSTMFWTYTLETIEDHRAFLCGNIHQNPELLK